MNKRNLFVTLGLALGLGFGAVAGLASTRYAKQVKADTATWAAGKVIYIRNSANGFQADAKAFLNYRYDDDGHYYQQEFTTATSITTKGDESLIRVVLERDCKDIQIHRTNSDQTINWQWSSKVYVANDTHNVLVWNNLDDDSGFYADTGAGVVEIDIAQPTNGNITVKNHNGNQSGTGFYYSSWNIEYNISTASPYYFDYWTSKSGELFVPFEGEDKDDNPLVLNNLEGEFTISAVVGNSQTDCNAFQNVFLHMNDSAYDAEDAGLCNTIPEGEEKDRYYLAKDAYNELHQESKEYFSTEAAYAAARARLNAWAVAHGEAFTITNGVGTLGAIVNVSIANASNSSSNSIVVIAIIASVILLATGGYLLIKKNKQD